jgi:phosphoribosylaminoimidazole (AIR) synthetase
MVAVVSAEDADAVAAKLAEEGETVARIGEIVTISAADEPVTFSGSLGF